MDGHSGALLHNAPGPLQLTILFTFYQLISFYGSWERSTKHLQCVNEFSTFDTFSTS